jgi:hypothetical protein
MRNGEDFFSCVVGEFVVNHKILKKRKIIRNNLAWFSTNNIANKYDLGVIVS